mmetsp:Transcript_25235/g.88018  ORF Transcript_25235/g.88018 Transcript_25235/m.88018 type:complete len:136 (-) Transcript_25235:159-566(-)
MATMRFCRECDNRLYAKEDRKERKLFFECRYCSFKQAADEGMEADAGEERTNCIYKHDIRKATTTTLDAYTDDLIYDVTLARIPLTDGCPNVLSTGEVCGHNEAVAFLGKTGSQTKIPVIYMCTNQLCCYRWEAH